MKLLHGSTIHEEWNTAIFLISNFLVQFIIMILLISSYLFFVLSFKCLVALQLYWNRISAWVFSYKFTAYFQNTFSEEYFRMAASPNHQVRFATWQNNSVIFSCHSEYSLDLFKKQFSRNSLFETKVKRKTFHHELGKS